MIVAQLSETENYIVEMIREIQHGNKRSPWFSPQHGYGTLSVEIFDGKIEGVRPEFSDKPPKKLGKQN